VRVCVIGGNLQGVEAAYLALKAGWEVVVVDKNSVVPAAGLCDRFIQLDVLTSNDLGIVLDGVDLVIPALENDAALACLNRWTRDKNMPFAFDPAAYDVSSSKVKSNRMFSRLGIPVPLPWPECGFPVVAKPSSGSGSREVMVFHDQESLKAYTHSPEEQWVVQQFVTGPSYSLEVIGAPGQYLPLQVTTLEMDKNFDCKRVLAPTDLPRALISDFEKISVAVADALGMKGLMDVEVVLHQDTLKVLEIDARLPSQTPAVVYWSSGINFVELLGELFVNGTLKSQPANYPQRGVVYEHIKVSAKLIETAGEHLISGADALRIQKGFFGADEALTNYSPGRDEWVATLIVLGKSLKTARDKRKSVISNIRKQLNLEVYRDLSPVELPEDTRHDPTYNR